MALEITTNDLPVTPDKQVCLHRMLCYLGRQWHSTHALRKKTGDVHVFNSSTHPFYGFTKAYIYIHILCAINILDYYRTLYNYIT